MKKFVVLSFIVALTISSQLAAQQTEAEPTWSGTLDRSEARQVFGSQLRQARSAGLEDLPPPKDGTGGFIKQRYGQEELLLWRGPAARIEPVKPKPDCPPIVIAVELWAELSNEKGERTGQLVNPESYLWSPGQHLYFWFKTTAPVHMAMIERKDVGTGLNPAEPGTLVSPNREFPLTYTVIQPGKAFRYPQLYQLNRDALPEFLTLFFIQAGSKLPNLNNPKEDGTPLPLDNVPFENPNLDDLTKKNNDLLSSYGKKVIGGKQPVSANYVMGRIGPVNPKAKPTKTVFENSDQASSVLLGIHPFGFRTVRIYKAVVINP